MYYITYALINANRKNSVPTTTVLRCKTKSKPRAFFLPNNCSAPPEIAPESPALDPDCSSTSTIKTTELMTNNILTIPPI